MIIRLFRLLAVPCIMLLGLLVVLGEEIREEIRDEIRGRPRRFCPPGLDW